MEGQGFTFPRTPISQGLRYPWHDSWRNGHGNVWITSYSRHARDPDRHNLLAFRPGHHPQLYWPAYCQRSDLGQTIPSCTRAAVHLSRPRQRSLADHHARPEQTPACRQLAQRVEKALPALLFKLDSRAADSSIVVPAALLVNFRNFCICGSNATTVLDGCERIVSLGLPEDSDEPLLTLAKTL